MQTRLTYLSFMVNKKMCVSFFVQYIYSNYPTSILICGVQNRMCIKNYLSHDIPNTEYKMDF